jgi:hypothetical protein
MRQVLQKIGGSLTRGGNSQPLLGARLRGDELFFQFVTPDRQVHSFSGQVSGGQISGTISSTEGVMSIVQGRRL